MRLLPPFPCIRYSFSATRSLALRARGFSVSSSDPAKDERVRDEDWVQDIAISDAMGHLNEREKKILRMRFFEGRTQMEVAGEIGISQAQVSRLEKHALMNMRKHLGE